LAKGKDDDLCFVVTGSRVSWARADAQDRTTFRLLSRDEAPLLADCTPRWDGKHRVLSVGGQIVKRYTRSSPNQEQILQAFEEQGWPCRIDDPLPHDDKVVPKLRLHDTIRWLNLKQESRLLRFAGDGTGAGVCWQPVPIGGLVLPAEPDEKLSRAA
jgi:hypothetical protein